MSRQETEEVDRLWRHAARLLDEVDSARAERDRYRLAWTSARQRAANHLAALVDADDERGFLRQVSRHLDDRLNDTVAERDEAQRQLSEMVDRSLDEGWRRVGYDIERQERYRLAWTSARRRAKRYDDLADELDERCAETRAERDEARAEVVRLGRALDAKRNTVRTLAESASKAQAELDCWRQAFGETALKDAADRLRAALDEERIEPESNPCDRTDLPEVADMRCPCGFEAGEHPAWRRRHCRNRGYGEHGAVSPCVLCGYRRPS